MRWQMLDVMILSVGCLVLAILISGGWVMTVFGQRIGVRELFTPVLVLSVLVILRMARGYRASVVPVGRSEFLSSIRLALCAGLVAAILLSPVLYAVGLLIAQGRFVSPPIYWRSSPSCGPSAMVSRIPIILCRRRWGMRG